MRIEKRTWSEFRKSGLLWFTNRMLHLFGYSIIYVFDTDSKTILDVYPARVEFRGFHSDLEEKGFRDISKYLVDNIDDLYKESLK